MKILWVDPQERGTGMDIPENALSKASLKRWHEAEAEWRAWLGKLQALSEVLEPHLSIKSYANICKMDFETLENLARFCTLLKEADTKRQLLIGEEDKD